MSSNAFDELAREEVRRNEQIDIAQHERDRAIVSRLHRQVGTAIGTLIGAAQAFEAHDMKASILREVADTLAAEHAEAIPVLRKWGLL